MPEVLEQTLPHRAEIFYPGDTEEKAVIYLEQREDDMGETSIHAMVIHRLLQVLLYFM